eukprot:1698264-Alexandrium_andersonii.AAC.1
MGSPPSGNLLVVPNRAIPKAVGYCNGCRAFRHWKIRCCSGPPKLLARTPKRPTKQAGGRAGGALGGPGG